MTAFAGSIGIIGIAAILALANGVDNYIERAEEETLSVYPLQIMSTGFDMTALMGMAVDGSTGDGGDATGEGTGDDPLAEMGLQGGKNGDETTRPPTATCPRRAWSPTCSRSLENNDLRLAQAVPRRARTATSTATRTPSSTPTTWRPRSSTATPRTGCARSIRTRRSPPWAWAPVRPTRIMSSMILHRRVQRDDGQHRHGGGAVRREGRAGGLRSLQRVRAWC